MARIVLDIPDLTAENIEGVLGAGTRVFGYPYTVLGAVPSPGSGRHARIRACPGCDQDIPIRPATP